MADGLPYSLAPYERRVIELLRNSKDKRARKLAKKRVRRLSNSADRKHKPTLADSYIDLIDSLPIPPAATPIFPIRRILT